MRGFNAIKFIMRSSDANAIGSVSAMVQPKANLLIMIIYGGLFR